ncbi:MAG: MFS transporter [Acidimicrobiia bacterium]
MTVGETLGRSGSRYVNVAGYLLYIFLLSAGYYYNLTFVQLGLVDLGTRRVGMTGGQVSVVMAGFAFLAFVVAVITGRVMDRKGWGSRLRVKLRLLFVVVATQTVLTLFAPQVTSSAGFVTWAVVGSVVIGAGIPMSFSLMSDLIPLRHRGYVAGVVAGLAFFAAAIYPLDWRIEDFAPVMTMFMVPGAAVLGVLAFRRFEFVDQLAKQHQRFGVGRFCRPTPIATASWEFWGLVVLMFAVFFIDSLGFLRIIDSPVYISTSWQSPEIGTRLFIAVSHVVGAAMAGVLYTAFGRRWLFLWIFGLFAFTHLLYTSHIQTAPAGIDPPLLLPLFYVLAVSFYTTLNFALWPDLSTPANIGTNTALGVGIAGWLASFLSTSLALYSASAGISLAEHLRYVNALALLFAVGYPVSVYVKRMRALAVERVS